MKNKQREIKFRAWDTKENKMIDWHELASKVMFFNYIDNPRYPIMQYTGLKDKNGTEIYEGDIIARYKKDYRSGKYYLSKSSKNHEHCRVVEWLNKPYTGWNFKQSEKSLWKVIGNIYENPELLDPQPDEKGEL